MILSLDPLISQQEALFDMPKSRSSALLPSVAALFIAVAIALPAPACTVWGAAGAEFVKGGGVLAAKIRDEKPLPQSYRRVEDGDGYAFEGLFAGPRGRFNTGVNAKGLFVGRAAASSVSWDTRLKFREFRSPEGYRGPEYLARRCATVEEALARTEVFTGRPVTLILADSKETAVVEVLPDGTHTVERRENGFVTHTNHYKQPASVPFNEKTGKSSETRLARINALLEGSEKPWTLEDFAAWTRDRNDGPDRSLFRTGSKKGGTRTLAAVTVRLAPDGRVHMRTAYQPDPENDSEWVVKESEFLRE